MNKKLDKLEKLYKELSDDFLTKIIRDTDKLNLNGLTAGEALYKISKLKNKTVLEKCLMSSSYTFADLKFKGGIK